MNLVFISREQYPDGGAPANRHLAYSKGLIEQGHKVTFILLSKQSGSEDRFSYEDILFICAGLKKESERTSFLAKLSKQADLLESTMKTINAIRKQNAIDAIILLTTWNQDLIPLIFMAYVLKVRVLHERTEYPFIDLRPGLRGRIDLWLYLHFIEKRFDGLYVINNKLVTYFNKYLNNKIPITVINMIVDPGRFKEIGQKKNDQRRYIAYCGVLNSVKDGVDTLVKSFIAASKSGKIPNNVSLCLIGEFSNERFKDMINELITKAAVEDKVILTGRLERSEIPAYLKNAEALALARPSNKQSEGGFPTKLGEYLATGKPVIITDTGEISLFLKDGENAFIAEPGSIQSFTDKMAEVFSNYQHAIEIGKKGRTLVENEFNYLRQAEKLAHFIKSLS